MKKVLRKGLFAVGCDPLCKNLQRSDSAFLDKILGSTLDNIVKPDFSSIPPWTSAVFCRCQLPLFLRGKQHIEIVSFFFDSTRGVGGVAVT